MERVELTTENIIDENVEKLAELFPEVVTEVRESDGTLRHTIDVEALKACVGDVADGQRERYQFTWPGKREAKQEAYRQIGKCLRPCPEESVNWDTTQNLYIEGDNLDALKLLRNTYAGKIKMIYIDPPYNTGHDFIYDDDFSKTKADYDAESGDYNEEGGRLVANPESNGRFHSDWCSMMYPRLLLARDLLSEDGVGLVSIGDDELPNLRKILDEIFGGDCYYCTFVWKSRAKPTNAGSAIYRPQKVAEYIVAIGKMTSEKILFEPITQDGRSYPHEDEGGRYRLVTILTSNRGTFQRETMTFEAGGFTPSKAYRWKAGKDKIDELFASGHIEFNADGIPMEKKYEQEEESPLSPIYTLIDVETSGTAELGKRVLNDLLGNNHGFDTVKPIGIITEMIRVCGSSHCTVLDFFSGSATTAHAVMQLNAEDGGNRKFIMVQLPEACDEKSEAAKAGYKNICEIGKERIRRAGKKIAEEIAEENRQPKLGEEPKKVPDIGFRVLKIDSSNFVDVSAEPAEYTQQTLAGLADNLKPGRTAEDLLFQVMPQFQIPLSAKIEKRDINGSSVFSVDDGRLVACFDRNVATETIVAMAKLQPDYAVMRDASFTGDDAVSNFGELFKTYSPATITRVV